MSDKTKPSLPHGIFIQGSVLNCQEKKGIAKASGNPYHMMTYMILCGTKVVSIQQTNAETARVHNTGDEVSIEIEPSFRDNGVILITGNVVAA
tara:strand:- start:905 stop:1183 length:279 start_codon:yes stop_codon:yes gene_type:complete